MSYLFHSREVGDELGYLDLDSEKTSFAEEETLFKQCKNHIWSQSDGYKESNKVEEAKLCTLDGREVKPVSQDGRQDGRQDGGVSSYLDTEETKDSSESPATSDQECIIFGPNESPIIIDQGTTTFDCGRLSNHIGKMFTAPVNVSRNAETTYQSGSPNVNTGSPNAKYASPGMNAAGSPGKKFGSPGVNTASPGVKTQSPGVNTGSPGVLAGSPGVKTASPTARKSIVNPDGAASKKSIYNAASGVKQDDYVMRDCRTSYATQQFLDLPCLKSDFTGCGVPGPTVLAGGYGGYTMPHDFKYSAHKKERIPPYGAAACETRVHYTTRSAVPGPSPMNKGVDAQKRFTTNHNIMMPKNTEQVRFTNDPPASKNKASQPRVRFRAKTQAYEKGDGVVKEQLRRGTPYPKHLQNQQSQPSPRTFKETYEQKPTPRNAQADDSSEKCSLDSTKKEQTEKRVNRVMFKQCTRIIDMLMDRYATKCELRDGCRPRRKSRVGGGCNSQGLCGGYTPGGWNKLKSLSFSIGCPSSHELDTPAINEPSERQQDDCVPSGAHCGNHDDPFEISTRLLGEVAFQLERRILDYVFGVKDYQRRFVYGYSVGNMRVLLEKEAKADTSFEETVERNGRLKRIMGALSTYGYDIAVHPEFSRKMINKFGLFASCPDKKTVKLLRLDDPVATGNLVFRLATTPSERSGMNTLFNCLNFCAMCENKPIFIW